MNFIKSYTLGFIFSLLSLGSWFIANAIIGHTLDNKTYLAMFFFGVTTTGLSLWVTNDDTTEES